MSEAYPFNLETDGLMQTVDSLDKTGLIDPPDGLLRPHWQRSEAMVLFSELADLCLPTAADDMTDQAILGAVRGAGVNWQENYPFQQAKYLAMEFHRHAISNLEAWLGDKDKDDFGHLNEGLQFTYYGQMEQVGRYDSFNTKEAIQRVLGEGFKAGMSFPLNLLLDLANQELVNVEQLSDVSEVLKQDWFVGLCEQASKTGNGYWKATSTDVYAALDIIEVDDTTDPNDVSPPYTGKHFTPIYDVEADGAVRFNSYATGALKKYLLLCNRGGNELASSGCPVRHTQPHFDDTPYDQASIDLLAKLFDKTPEELTRPRERSAIATGIGSLTTVFDRAVLLC